jgi:threonine dehydrogenase-like Zn-dependent dehydrogenase
VQNTKVGDRVIVSCTISCGSCEWCKDELYSLCDNTNPNGAAIAKMTGYPTAGLYGYSHLYGGYWGGQAEYVRVPFADTGCFKIPDGMDYEKALFLSDILPTGFMAAENAGIKYGDTVAVWGCGPVGLFAMRSAMMLGAETVIGIDRFAPRLSLARQIGAQTINYEQEDVFEIINQMTGGRGPNSCIDAVGMEAHAMTLDGIYDFTMQKLRMETDRSHALREAIRVCGKGGTVSIIGAYSGFIDKFPIGIGFAKGLTMKMGTVHVQKYLPRLLEAVHEGKIDPTFLISHRWPLADAPDAYELFSKKEDGAVKFVLTP